MSTRITRDGAFHEVKISIPRAVWLAARREAYRRKTGVANLCVERLLPWFEQLVAAEERNLQSPTE